MLSTSLLQTPFSVDSGSETTSATTSTSTTTKPDVSTPDGSDNENAEAAEEAQGTFNSSIFGEYTDIIIFVLIGITFCCIIIGICLLLRSRKKTNKGEDIKQSTIEMHENTTTDITTPQGTETFHFQTDLNQLTVPTNAAGDGPGGAGHQVVPQNSASSIPGYHDRSPSSPISTKSLPNSPPGSPSNVVSGSPKQVVIKMNQNRFIYNNVNNLNAMNNNNMYNNGYYMNNNINYNNMGNQQQISLPPPTPGDMFDDRDYEQEIGSPISFQQPGMNNYNQYGNMQQYGDMQQYDSMQQPGMMSDDSIDPMYDDNLRKLSGHTIK